MGRKHELRPVRNPDELVGFLKALEALNSDTNQAMDYSLIPLTPSGSLENSLQVYFSRLDAKRTSPLGPTLIKPLADIKPKLRSWLFSNFGTKQDQGLETFVNLLADCLHWTESYQVQGDTPRWYDCSYDDIAFVTPSGYWLLHLGVSD